MLKWAVNGPRQSYLPTVGECEVMHGKVASTVTRRSLSSLLDADPTFSNVERRRLRRKSSDMCSLRRKLRTQDKENHLTSTPLPVSMRSSSPSRKLDSFKDLSNITPEDFAGSPYKHTTQRQASAPHTPVAEGMPKLQPRSIPAQYASTLPTFDVEYSPCGLVPGPILALRGIGIADTYFEKPRYLTQQFQELHRREAEPDRSPKSTITAQSKHEESSLSSSKMGDTTLERMIDAILESARKERKVPKATKQTNCPPVMSPTYTPADDPASDLNEFWDTASAQYQPKASTVRHSIQAKAFNEREVRSPLAGKQQSLKQQQHNDALHLRRQRAVRRKRKMTVTTVTASVKSSAQKMFALSGRMGVNSKSLDAAEYEKGKQCKEQAHKQVRNISPDSGRNSCSDCEDSTLEGCSLSATKAVDKSSDALDATKRRLNFSINDKCESES